MQSRALNAAHVAYNLTVVVGFFAFVQAQSLAKLSLLVSIPVIGLFLNAGFFFLARTVYWGFMTTTVLSVRPWSLKETSRYMSPWLEREMVEVTPLIRLERASIEQTKKFHRFWTSICFYKSRTFMILAVFYFLTLGLMYAAYSLLAIHALVA